jgi:hypothetical protein
VDKIQINCHLLTLELTIEALNTARAKPLRGITGGSSYHRGGPSPGRAWWSDWRPRVGPRGGGLTAPLVVVDCAIGDPSVGRAASRGSRTKRWRWRGRLTWKSPTRGREAAVGLGARPLGFRLWLVRVLPRSGRRHSGGGSFFFFDRIPGGICCELGQSGVLMH